MPYVYVSPDGSDANSGLSSGLPKLTLQAAIDVAGSGDTIRMKAGTYTTTGVTTINGKSLEIIIYTPSKKWSKGILDGPGTGILLSIENLAAGQWVKLIGLKFKDGATAVSVTNQNADSDITAFGCWFDDTLTTGFAGGAGRCHSHSSTFVGMTTGFSASGDADAFGCTFFDVTTGFAVTGSGTATWKNSIFGGTRTIDVDLDAAVTAVADFNGYGGTPSTSVVSVGATDHATLSAWNTASSQDASGVDPATVGLVSETSPYDAHLIFDSPMKDIGTNIFDISAQYGDSAFRPEAGADNLGAWKTNVGVGSFNRIKDPRTLFVRTTGSDVAGNGTSTAPYLTVQHAIDTLKGHAINAVVTVDIGAGTFSGSVIIDDELVVSGVEGPAILLKGAGFGSTTIDGTTNDRVLKVVGAVFLQLQDFTLGPVASTATRYIEIGGKAKVEIVPGGTVVIDHNTTSGEGVSVVSGMLSVSGQLTVNGASSGVRCTYGGMVSIPSGGRLDVDGADSKAFDLDNGALAEIIGTLDIGTSVRGIVVERGSVLTVQSGAAVVTSTSGRALDVNLNGTVTFVDGLTGTVTAGTDGAGVARGSTVRIGGTLSLTLSTQAAHSAVNVSRGSTLLCGNLTSVDFNTAVTALRRSIVELGDTTFSAAANVSVGTYMLTTEEESLIVVEAVSANMSGWSNYMLCSGNSRIVLAATSRTITQAAQDTMYKATGMSSILIDGGTHDCFNASSNHVDVTEFGLMKSANVPVWQTGGVGTIFRANVVAGTFDTGAADGGLAFS